MDLLERRPDSPEWRADALARSGHSRLTSEGVLPTCHPDQLPADQADPCGEICRGLLGDFAPALLLLDAPSRRRVQALAALARALDDCSREHGTEGQRLAALNRWEFALENALDGAPSAHPVFAAMAHADAERHWPRSALSELLVTARRRALGGDADGGAAELVPALGAALFGQPPPARLVALGAAILRAPRPAAAYRQAADPGGVDHRSAGAAAPAADALAPSGLADAAAIDEAPPEWRAALRYALLAARAHLAAAAAGGQARRLAAFPRLVLLARARWSRGFI